MKLIWKAELQEKSQSCLLRKNELICMQRYSLILRTFSTFENPTSKHNRAKRIFLPKEEFFYRILRDEIKIPQVKVMLIEDFPRDC